MNRVSLRDFQAPGLQPEGLEVNSRGSPSASRGAPTESDGIEPAPCMGATTSPRDEESVALLESLVRIPSPSRRESAAVRFLVERMNSLGLRAHIDGAGTAVGIRESARACFSEDKHATRERACSRTGVPHTDIVLLGHIDTVPGDIPVRREGDRLCGRGTGDA